MSEAEIGVVRHFFDNIGVAAIEITSGKLTVGNTVHVKGHTSDFTATVDSMQVKHESVETARECDSIGIKVPEKAREHDKVFLAED